MLQCEGERVLEWMEQQTIQIEIESRFRATFSSNVFGSNNFFHSIAQACWTRGHIQMPCYSIDGLWAKHFNWFKMKIHNQPSFKYMCILMFPSFRMMKWQTLSQIKNHTTYKFFFCSTLTHWNIQCHTAETKAKVQTTFWLSNFGIRFVQMTEGDKKKKNVCIQRWNNF